MRLTPLSNFPRRTHSRLCSWAMSWFRAKLTHRQSKDGNIQSDSFEDAMVSRPADASGDAGSPPRAGTPSPGNQTLGLHQLYPDPEIEHISNIETELE